jgi:hypothetical protein
MITDTYATEKLGTILTGLTGVTLIEMTPALPTPEEISQIGHLIIQIAIGLVTLWRLVKSPKGGNNNNTPEPPNHPVG